VGSKSFKRDLTKPFIPEEEVDHRLKDCSPEE
jgi:hypothetical protein